MTITPASDRLDSVFCSKDCQVGSKVQSQNLLFGFEPPLPPELAPELSPSDMKQRDVAQAAYVDYVKKHGKTALLLVARFIARQVAAETAKMMPKSASLPLSGLPEADSGDYTLYDHVERLRYLEFEVSEEEVKLLAKVLATAVPGLEQFVTDERYATLLGKMAYNSFGVCFGGGRDDKVPVHLRFALEFYSLLLSNDSLLQRNDLRMPKRHGPHMGLQNRSAAGCIWFQHMYLSL